MGTLAYCGLDCSGCPIHTAGQAHDLAMQRTVAEEVNRRYAVFMPRPVTREDIVCDGCQAGGLLFIGCTTCTIRQCAMARGLATCAACAEMETCEQLSGFHSQEPRARETLQRLRDGHGN